MIVDLRDWYVDYFLEYDVSVGFWGPLQTIFYNIRAKLIKRKLHYIVDYRINDLDFFVLQAILEDVSDDVVAILLWREVVGRSDDLLDDWVINVAPGEFLQHSLDYAATSLILAEEENLILHKRDYELDFSRGQVQNDTLDNIVTFFREHHFNQQLVIELGDDLFLLFEG